MMPIGLENWCPLNNGNFVGVGVDKPGRDGGDGQGRAGQDGRGKQGPGTGVTWEICS